MMTTMRLGRRNKCDILRAMPIFSLIDQLCIYINRKNLFRDFHTDINPCLAQKTYPPQHGGKE